MRVRDSQLYIYIHICLYIYIYTWRPALSKKLCPVHFFFVLREGVTLFLSSVHLGSLQTCSVGLFRATFFLYGVDGVNSDVLSSLPVGWSHHVGSMTV